MMAATSASMAARQAAADMAAVMRVAGAALRRRAWASAEVAAPAMVVELLLGPAARRGPWWPRPLTGSCADGRLGREHQGAGPVEHGVGHVGHLGPGGRRGRHHRLEHLRGGDHRAAVGDTGADDALLEVRHVLEGAPDAQVAPGHHHAVGRRDDRRRGRRRPPGSRSWPRASGPPGGARRGPSHVGRPPHERDGDGVDARLVSASSSRRSWRWARTPRAGRRAGPLPGPAPTPASDGDLHQRPSRWMSRTFSSRAPSPSRTLSPACRSSSRSGWSTAAGGGGGLPRPGTRSMRAPSAQVHPALGKAPGRILGPAGLASTPRVGSTPRIGLAGRSSPPPARGPATGGPRPSRRRPWR